VRIWVNERWCDPGVLFTFPYRHAMPLRPHRLIWQMSDSAPPKTAPATEAAAPTAVQH